MQVSVVMRVVYGCLNTAVVVMRAQCGAQWSPHLWQSFSS